MDLRTRVGAVAVAAAALAGVLVTPPMAADVRAAEAASVPQAVDAKKKKQKRGFLTADQLPTWEGMGVWEHSPITPGKKPSGMYCATEPLPALFTRFREHIGGAGAYAMQHTTWLSDEHSAKALVETYLANAANCSTRQVRKALFAESSVEFLGRNRLVGDGLALLGVFYHVPAHGFIEPYDAMRLFAVGRVGRVVTTVEMWRDGVRHSSRIKPFRELAKTALSQYER